MIERKTILTLDTECCDLSGNVYDVGYTIHNRKGEIFTTYNALAEEIFTDAEKMTGAFYAKKLFTHYAPMLDAGTISLKPWAEIVAQMQAHVEEYRVNVLAAYNLGFDRRVMRQTNARLGNGPILPKMDMLDIWQFACETKLSSATYKQIARCNGWVSSTQGASPQTHIVGLAYSQPNRKGYCYIFFSSNIEIFGTLAVS